MLGWGDHVGSRWCVVCPHHQLLSYLLVPTFPLLLERQVTLAERILWAIDSKLRVCAVFYIAATVFWLWWVDSCRWCVGALNYGGHKEKVACCLGSHHPVFSANISNKQQLWCSVLLYFAVAIAEAGLGGLVSLADCVLATSQL